MLREKRIRKPVQSYSISQQNDESPKKKQLVKKRASIKGCYQMVPLPTKFSYSNQIYELFGNIVLMEKDGVLITEPSLLNHCVNYRDIQISKFANQKLVTIAAEKRKDSDLPNWKNLVEKLSNSSNEESQAFGQIVQNYSERYEDFFSPSTQESTPDHNKEDSFVDSAEVMEKKKAKIMESSPSICFTSHVKSQEESTIEISATQKFLLELGYSIDAFASTVIQEGLPQLFSCWQNNTMRAVAKVIMENYFNATLEGFQSCEFEAPLLLKSGYVKNVKFQIHLLLRKESVGFTMDTIFTILGKNTPFFQEKSLDQQLNLEFLNLMNFKEIEMASFLSMFYQESPSLHYTNMDKICRIQEIDDTEDDD
jgi:hypothetical protein